MAGETNTGWVRLYRSTLGWEWFGDPLTLQLWVVCLLKANWQPLRWQGTTIGRGSFVTSVEKLCATTGQTARQIRTRLERLQASGEIEVRATNRKSIITICKFDTYQSVEMENDKLPTNCYGDFPEVAFDQTQKNDELNDELKTAVSACSVDGCCGWDTVGDEPDDKQPTNKRQTQLFSSDNNIRIYKEIKELKESLSSRARASEAERETFFEIFFFKNFVNPDYEVERFCANYEASGWIRKNGRPVVDRAALARAWTQEDKNAAPRFNAEFLAGYRRFYDAIKQRDSSLAPFFLHDLEQVFIDTGHKRLTFRCSQRMAAAIEANILCFREHFFDKHFTGWELRYQIPKILTNHHV